MQIAIDGYSASGKSSVAKGISKRLKINYLDTGSMYRVITANILKVLNIKIITNEDISQYLQQTKINFSFDHELRFNNKKIKQEEIRHKKVDENVSIVASNYAIRDILTKQQQNIISQGSWIVDGRDIATVVIPNAKYKFFLDADTKIRAKRRILQNENANFEKTLENIRKRDKIDTQREIAPLIKDDRYIIIDSSKLTFEETVNEFLKYIK